MTFKARYGTVEVGDYVISITAGRNYQFSSCVGKMLEDGRIATEDGHVRSGGEGCPLCKIDESLVSEQQKKSINRTIDKLPTFRYFIIHIKHKGTWYDRNGLKKNCIYDIVQKSRRSAIPQDASKEDTEKLLFKSLKKMWASTLTMDEVEIKEVDASTYASTAEANQTIVLD